MNVRRLVRLQTIESDLFREYSKVKRVLDAARRKMTEEEMKKFHMAHAKELTRPVAPITIYPLTRKMPTRGDA
jgi:hypothetical protein